MESERSRSINERPPGLVDVLDRILDKGLVIAGDIKISLVNIELLTLKIRLLICSIDKAEEIGLNWWRYDPYLTMNANGGANALPPGQDTSLDDSGGALTARSSPAPAESEANAAAEEEPVAATPRRRDRRKATEREG